MKKNQNLISRFGSRATILKTLVLIFVLMGLLPTTAQQSYTFTNCGMTGSLGPTSANTSTAYLLTNLNGSVGIGGGIQTFTIPFSGNYRIEAYGAAGGTQLYSPGYLGGRGAFVQGDFTLTAGTVLSILVGQMGGNTQGTPVDNAAPGGGGGSFVYISPTSPFPLVAAGGGGGGGRDPGLVSASTGSNGHAAFVGGAGGRAGNGGQPTTGGSSYWAGGGAGWLSDGTGGNNASAYVYTAGSTGALGGRRPANGGAGGWRYSDGTDEGGDGGFGGGGGGGSDNMGTGGGGGFSGGGGARSGGNGNPTGGGGGSYNGGANQVNTASVNVGHGRVIIRELCFISLTASTSNSLAPSICSGTSVTLTTNAATNYTWSTGNTSTTSIVVTPTVTTTYSIVGTSTANCQAASYITITVYPALPTLTVVNTGTTAGGVCPAQAVTVTASGAVTYTWTGGLTNGVPYVPTLPGSYTVTGENACGTSTAATSVSIHPIPTVGTVVSTPTICSGNPVSLTGVGNAVTYTWTGGIFNGINFFPPTTGSYTVTGTSALNCTNTAVSTITVVTTPVAQPFSAPPLICIGNSSSLTAAGATNYTWTTPTGVFNTTSISVTPTVTTTYTVTKANANCVNTQTVSVIVNMLPSIFAIVTPTLTCASKPATLTAAGAATYTWAAAGPPVFTVTGANPVVSPAVSTMYTITASDGTCVNTGTVFLAVNPNPTLSVVPSSSVICRGQSATLTASGALSYTWTTPSATIANVSIVESPTNSVLYTVVGTNTFNCTSPVSQVIVVNPTPTLQVYSNKPLVCIGAPASLTVSGANTYQWDANANNATTPVAQVNPLTTTIYSVTGFITATGCNSTKTIQINVFSPTFAVNNPTSSCLGGTINLIATGAISYTWNGNQPFQTISVSPPTATVYVVSATSQSNGVSCISSNSVGVSIYANPTITAIAQRTLICKGEYGNLVANGAQTYVWNTSQTGSLVPVNPTAAQNIFSVTGTDQNGCVGTATVMQKVSTCFGISEQSAAQLGLSVFPNPNNGTFTIKSTVDLNLTLVNELGQLVEIITLSSDNNHQHKLDNLTTGIYFLIGEHGGFMVKEKVVILK
ncbi:MAG: T9SS type A sorting domain-containing protein [bacterium]|nr:T9SS type A sorting domain-containing protein [bacterium]